MTDAFPQILGAVYQTDEVVTELARAEDGALFFQHRLKSELESEQAAVFLGAGRRGKASPHASFETIISASKTGYDSAFLAAERLEQLHTSALYSGDEALPSTLVLRVIVDLLTGLAECHEQGQVNGPFALSQVVLGIDGHCRLTGRALSALAAHRSGTLSTSVSDLKALGTLIGALLPSEASDDGAWPGIRAWLSDLNADAFADGVEALESLGELSGEAARPADVVRWLKKHYPSRLERWAEVTTQTDPTDDIKELMNRVPVREKPEPEPVPVPSGPVATATPAPQVGRLPKRGLIADGTEPDIYAERDEDDLQRRRLVMDDLLDSLSETEATGDPNSALVLEITRVAHNIAMQTELLHVGNAFRSEDGLTAKLDEDEAQVTLPKDAKGWYYRYGEKTEISARAHILRLGERALIELKGRQYRIRVDRASRSAGRATGIRLPWKLWASCLSAALFLHVVFLWTIGVYANQSAMQLTVEQPDDKDRYARLKKPSELKKKKEEKKKKKKKKVVKKKKKKIVKKKKKKKRPIPRPIPPEKAPQVSERTFEKTAQVREKYKNMKQEEAIAEMARGSAESNMDLNPNSFGSNLNSAKSGRNPIGGNSAMQVGDEITTGRGSAGEVATNRTGSQTAGKMKMRKGRKGRPRGKVKKFRIGRKVQGQGKLSMSAVQKVLDRATRKIQSCYERAMMKSSKPLSGKIKLRWVIKANGKVSGVKSVQNSVSPVVGKCVMKVIKRLKFPRPKGGSVIVTYPWIFSQQ